MNKMKQTRSMSQKGNKLSNMSQKPKLAQLTNLFLGAFCFTSCIHLKFKIAVFSMLLR